MYRVFGDLFMYKERTHCGLNVRGFKDCVLLRDALGFDNDVDVPRLTKVGIIFVYSSGRIEFVNVENGTDFFIKKQNLKNENIEYIFEIFSKSLVTETYEYLLDTIEDFYGCVYDDENEDLLMWYCDTMCRRDSCASKIQEQFRTAISNPDYKMCRDRLLREFHEEGLQFL